MQVEFIDLLGFDEISTIEQFITNRDEIVESFEIAKMALDSKKEKIKSAQENLKLFGNDTIVETQIGKNKKSVAYSMIFRDKNKTLSDEEVNTLMSNIITELEKTLNAELRK